MRNVLMELAAEPDINRAMHAATRLQILAPRASGSEVDLLIGATTDDDAVTAIGALHAVAGVADTRVDQMLAGTLADERPWMREHAAWVLAARRPQSDIVGALAQLVGSESSLTAMVAQRTLAAWGERSGAAVEEVLVDEFVRASDSEHRRRLIDTLGVINRPNLAPLLMHIAQNSSDDESVRVAAIGAMTDYRCDLVDEQLRHLATQGTVTGTAALLALDDAVSPAASPADAPGEGRGLRVGQLTLTGELDGSLDRAGMGDTGGVASLLVSLSHAFARQHGVESVLTIGRSTIDGELGCLLVPDMTIEAFAAVGVGVGRSMKPLATAWDERLSVERSIRRVLLNRPKLDVLHLRMADVGTLAAASVARKLGVRLAFTCAPDPHAPIEAQQRTGLLDRENFGAVDQVEHLWFRARMVERLAAQADQLILLPRRGAVERVQRLVGIETERLERDAVVSPEGIDLHEVDAGIESVVQCRSAVVDELRGLIDPARRGLPIVVSVGRLHPVKGMPRIVGDWLDDHELATTTNLVIVGGDLTHPSPTESAVLDQIESRCADDPNRTGVLLLGARPRADASEVLAACALGVGDEIAEGGVYVNGAAKEEFGLALLEALACGLPVVAPCEGGPTTYVTADAGVLVDATEPLGPAIARAFELHDRPGRTARVRDMIEECYTIDACAQSLIGAYERVPLGTG